MRRVSSVLLVAGLAGLILLQLAGPAGAVVLQSSGSPTSGDPALRLWLDATAPGSIFQDTTGTTPAADGTPVALWKDQSGNGLDVSQGSAGNRPSFESAIGSLGSQPAVAFVGGSGGDALSRVNDTGISGNADRTVITVWQNTGFTGQNFQHTFHMGTPSTNQAYGHSTARAGGLGSRIGNHYWAGDFNTTAIANLDANMAISIWDGDGGTGANGLDSWFVDGAAAGASDRAALTTGTSQLQIGSRLNPFTEGFTGYLSEVIVYDQAITAAERSQLQRYLSSKYKVPLRTVWDFEDDSAPGTPSLDGWTIVAQSSGADDVPYLQPEQSEADRIPTEPCLTTAWDLPDGSAGGFRGDGAHDILIARSPKFAITAPGEITWQSVGGEPGAAVDPGTGVGPYPANAVGVSLVRASDDYRVLSVETAQTATLTNYQFDITPYLLDGNKYYLEVVDNYSGGFGYVEWDNFSVAYLVPEPSTLSLAALGVLGLAFCGRRRKWRE